MALNRILQTRASALSAAVLTLALFLLYYVLMMRKAKPTTLTTVHLSTPAFYIAHFGAAYFYGNLALELLTAALTAILVVGSVTALRTRMPGGGAGASGTAATILIAVATFGCPTCVLPLAGSLGLGLFASGLPLLGTEFRVLALIPLVIGLWIVERKTSDACARRDAAATRRPPQAAERA